MSQSLFNKVTGQCCNFIKKETLTQVFPYEFCEISKNTYSTEHIWTNASKTSDTCKFVQICGRKTLIFNVCFTQSQ